MSLQWVYSVCVCVCVCLCVCVCVCVERCKEQSVCADHRTALYKSYLLQSLLFTHVLCTIHSVETSNECCNVLFLLCFMWRAGRQITVHKQRTQRISYKLVGEPMKFSLYLDLVWNKVLFNSWNKVLFNSNRKHLFCVYRVVLYFWHDHVHWRRKERKERAVWRTVC